MVKKYVRKELIKPFNIFENSFFSKLPIDFESRNHKI